MKTTTILILLVVGMLFVSFYSDPVTYKTSTLKVKLVNDMGSDDGSKFHNSIAFHRFEDSLGNAYNVKSLEPEGTPTLKNGDSVILHYNYMAARLLRHDSFKKYTGYTVLGK